MMEFCSVRLAHTFGSSMNAPTYRKSSSQRIFACVRSGGTSGPRPGFGLEISTKSSVQATSTHADSSRVPSMTGGSVV
jgi:hypothetical protein